MRDLTWMLMGIAAIVGGVALTAMEILPTEVMAGAIMTIVTAIFGHQQYQALDKSWQEFYDKEKEGWFRAKED